MNGNAGVLSFDNPGAESVHENLSISRLYEEAIRRKEARLVPGGALSANTGAHTGRSPHDKFIVRDAVTQDAVWWGANQAMTPEHFERLRADMLEHAARLELFAQNLHGGADPAFQLNVRVITEYAWHSLFIRNLLIRPSATQNWAAADLTILSLPSFRADPSKHGCRSQTVIAIDFARRLVLIGGTAYAGEIKKSVFTFLNFMLPPKGVLPMHCAANTDETRAALFFGLSGTGKTTLSADPSRRLVGDDEHGWGDNGVFNFEGGCYAKAIKLSREAEPDIYATTQRFGTVLENVVLDPLTGAPDFDDASRTENTRIAYPLDFIANAEMSGRAGHPTDVVMLTCDAFGVLPPIVKLTPSQAMYHFLSGYTAKVAGTERGVKEPQATFSTCFGAPFMPRHPSEYGNLLRARIAQRDVNCWLINTGWSGGGYGVGARMPISLTRALLHAALDGSLTQANFRVDPYFRLAAPVTAPGVDAALLDPEKNWASKRDFRQAALRLSEMFRENFADYAPFVDRDVMDSQPRVDAAA